MKNKQTYFLLYLVLITLNLKAQLININPDPNGKPWLVGGATLPTSAELALLTPLHIAPSAMAIQIPNHIYNNEYVYFPPIFYQPGQSCVHAAEIGYTFTYEINCSRGVAAGNWDVNKENCYSPLFTYNFVNNGIGTTQTPGLSGFKIIQENGCPSFDTYFDPVLNPPGNSDGFLFWMTDYSKYLSGMYNRISNYYNISLSPNPLCLDTLKHWLYNHGTTEINPGGLAVFSVYADGWVDSNILPAGTPFGGQNLIASWGTSGVHELTIVGYNDEICCFDLNNNGQYTNNIDIDGDNDIDLFDFEKGAFKVANSWDLSWGNQGFIWVPYRLMAEGLVLPNAYVCQIDENYQAPLTVKAKVDYTCRSKLQFKVAYASYAFQNIPVGATNYYSFNYQGGCKVLRGVPAYAGPIEVGLDFGYWFKNDDVGKVFFIIGEDDINNEYNGFAKYFSIVDNRWGEVFELPYNEEDISIVNNAETILAINYDLIQHESPITANTLLFSDMVSRFTPTVTSGAMLTVENGARIDMYNSEIHIEAGSTLALNSGTQIIAKRGACKIVVDGTITVGSNVLFKAEEGAQLEVVLNNTSLTANFNQVEFDNCILSSYAQNLTITASSFTNCYIARSYRGNVTVSNSNFTGTCLNLENQTIDQNLTARVSYCTFNNSAMYKGIYIWNYGKYFIDHNTIQSNDNGIQISYSGNGIAGNQFINNNHIYNSNMAGVMVYSTTGYITENNIHNNKYGIRLMNNCNISLYGNSSAQGYSQTQQISNNTLYEVYASQYSFPWYFRYNVIIDDNNAGNPADPLVFYDNQNQPPSFVQDVKYNWWGSGFNAAEDLKITNGTFSWLPTWCPGGGGSSDDPVKDIYVNATSNFENGNYSDAKNLFQFVIQQYPESEYAKAAMKQLYSLEEYSSSNYTDLKSYYRTNDTIVSDTTLKKLGDILANTCDVKLENWPVAIDWYENKIMNPSCLEDSVFAIIDLGNTYLLMQNQRMKSTYTGNLQQFKPESKEKYTLHTDYLLSLLPNVDKKEAVSTVQSELKQGILYQNIPNPFSTFTQIGYGINEQAIVLITISDLSGKVIRRIDEGYKTEGEYKVDVETSNLASGTYLYSLILNGKMANTKKMNIVR